MNKTNLIKTGTYLTGACTAALGLTLTGASTAYAAGWDAESMMSNAGRDASVTAKPITSTTINAWVTSITAWLVGIAVIIFVLRIVLTAIDRMIFSEAKNNAFRLSDIPLVGAYDEEIAWKDIWLKKFVVQLGIVCGAWLIVQVLMGIVLWLFSAVN